MVGAYSEGGTKSNHYIIIIIIIIILYSNTVYSIQMVFEKEDHEVIPI